MKQQPNHLTSFFTVRGESAPRKMERLADLAEELGGISVTRVTGTDAKRFGLSPAELERQRRLDTDLGLKAIHLSHAHVSTMRDALVLGRSGIIRIAGPENSNITNDMARVEGALSRGCPDEVLLDEPSPADIAGICLGLDQVHGGVLPTYQWFVNAAERTKVGGSVERRPLLYGLTVGNILDPSAGILPQILSRHDPAIDSRYDKCHQEAITFAAEFTAAHEALAQGNNT
jgi:hypothetical protein